MPVVVTGAAGFLGRALVADLLLAGHRVTALDRRPFPAALLPPGAAVPLDGAVFPAGASFPGETVRPGADFHPDLTSFPRGTVLPGAALPAGGATAEWGAGLVVVQADLLGGDPAVAAALAGADAVFHLAGRPGVRDGGMAAETARARDNVAATAAVLAAVPRDTPLVVTSSSSVYGGALGRPSREDDPLRPLGGYAASKAAAERLCAARGGAVTVLRPFTVAGEGQRPDMALARWIAAVRAGRPVEILGSPARTRDVTDVRDVVRALRAAAERGVTGPLNVGTGRPRTLAELAAAVCRALGVPAELIVSPAAAVEPADTWADTTRLGRRLGFVPVTDLDDLVTRQVAAAGTPTPALAG
jgi:nucleoside-diphosphate-sugar epimerase